MDRERLERKLEEAIENGEISEKEAREIWQQAEEEDVEQYRRDNWR
jgi:hypothetical protein